MDPSEPALKPQWLLSPGTNGASSLQIRDEHGVGFSSQHRSTPTGDRDRSLLTSSRKSLSSNYTRSFDRDISGKSRAYSSFGSCNRNRDREKNFDYYDREHFESLASRPEKDALRRSRSMVSGRPADPRDGGTGVRSSNDVLSRASTATSFERDFPSLGTKEKNGRAGISRVSSPGIGSSIHSIPIGLAAIPGAESWNSVLVEAPSTKVRSTGQGASDGLHASSSSQFPLAPHSSTGLNMAETVAQVPSKVRSLPQPIVENQKMEELTLKHYSQLIPVTLSAKNSVAASSEKLKNRGRVLNPVSVSRMQVASQPVSAAARAPVRNDINKPSQSANFLVLNRDKNGMSASVKDSLDGGKAASSPGLSPLVSVLPAKHSAIQKSKSDTKTAALSSFGEKRLQSQAKRSEFFNYIRSKTSAISSSSVESGSPSSITDDSERHNDIDGYETNGISSSPTLSKALENGNINELRDSLKCHGEPRHCNNDFHTESLMADDEEIDPCPEPVPEEEALLRSLGWDPSPGPALTKEEIDAFKMKYKDIKLSRPSE